MKTLKKFFSNKNIILALGFLALVLFAAISICTGPAGMGAKDKTIVLYVRLPRTLACVFAGAGLSVSGAILQRVLANKLASPGIIGVNAGAGFGITLGYVLGAASGVLYSVSAFAGAMLAVFAITLAAYKTRAAKTTVILGGVAINAILNAATEAITVLNSDARIMNADFRVGGFSAVSYVRLVPAAFMIVLALVIVFTLLNDLDVISMGDETARGLGMNVRRTKNIFLVLAALLAGASVSFAGLLGFIGLIIPHFVRRVCGGNSKTLILGSAIFGSALLTVSDLAARIIFSPFELPVGIIMAAAGGPVFVALLIRKKGGHAND
ncbi:MAG: iron ABC transporter permease [Clostridia bacterium]|nr:iron ABC transporter permease [Clostridia bacterium]